MHLLKKALTWLSLRNSCTLIYVETFFGIFSCLSKALIAVLKYLYRAFKLKTVRYIFLIVKGLYYITYVETFKLEAFGLYFCLSKTLTAVLMPKHLRFKYIFLFIEGPYCSTHAETFKLYVYIYFCLSKALTAVLMPKPLSFRYIFLFIKGSLCSTYAETFKL